MDDQYLGMIAVFAFNFAPRTWAQCSGQLVNISQNPALFKLLGTMYGGNGTTNFALPDLRGRRVVGAGQNYVQGQPGGQERITLGINQMPPHTHTGTFTIPANGDMIADTPDPTGAYLGTPDGTGFYTYTDKSKATGFMGDPKVTLGTAGASQPVSTLSPGLALTCCIATTGIFPSRN